MKKITYKFGTLHWNQAISHLAQAEIQFEAIPRHGDQKAQIIVSEEHLDLMEKLMNTMSEYASKDVSFLWHTVQKYQSFIFDYSFIFPETSDLHNALVKQFKLGFTTCLRELEQLGHIEMGDINRKANIDDLYEWEKHFKNDN